MLGECFLIYEVLKVLAVSHSRHERHGKHVTQRNLREPAKTDLGKSTGRII
jgi:hypothetical protein